MSGEKDGSLQRVVQIPVLVWERATARREPLAG
jgi:hypothetical protein